MPPDSGEPSVIDRLELELRQLHGVSFVAFVEGEGPTVVELAVEPGFDVEALHAQASRLVQLHMDGQVTVEVVDGLRSGGDRPDPRVQLLVALPVLGRESVEIRLAHQGRRVTVEAYAEDGLTVAQAVINGLGLLGIPAPYVAVAAQSLDSAIGDGMLVVLREQATGEIRRGVAAGRSTAEATARAVLNALNRFLQSAPIQAELPS